MGNDDLKQLKATAFVNHFRRLGVVKFPLCRSRLRN